MAWAQWSNYHDEHAEFLPFVEVGPFAFGLPSGLSHSYA
jgi:hypothetical protein